MLDRVNAWDSVAPLSPAVCRTADDVRALARRMARRPVVPIVRFKKPEPAPPPKPKPLPDTAPLCRKIILLMWRGPDATSRITTSQIIGVVALHYGFTRLEILSSAKPFALAHARHVAMYLARELTSNSFISLGAQFGGRDHSTVYHAVTKIKSRLETDPVLAVTIDDLRRGLMA